MSLPTAIFITQITELLKISGVKTNREFATVLSALIYDRVLCNNKYRSEEDVSEIAVEFSIELINLIEDFLNEIDTPPPGFFEKTVDKNAQE